MSSIVLVQNSDLTSEEAVRQVKQMVTEKYSRQFKDISGGLLEDSTNGAMRTNDPLSLVNSNNISYLKVHPYVYAKLFKFNMN
jgi:hypothetical protein